MKAVPADLALESAAAAALALRLARTYDRPGDERERILRRLLTPAAKFWVCKRAAAFVQEAVESLGGNGYVEAGGEGVMARLYREAPLNSIWEGAGNLMALDLLRALKGGKGEATAVEALAAELAPARGRDAAFDRHADALLAGLGQGGIAGDEAGARRLARDLALAVQAALLAQQGQETLFEGFCRSWLNGAGGVSGAVFGELPAGVDVAGIVEDCRAGLENAAGSRGTG